MSDRTAPTPRDVLAAALADVLTKDWPGDTRHGVAPAIADYLLARADVRAALTRSKPDSEHTHHPSKAALCDECRALRYPGSEPDSGAGLDVETDEAWAQHVESLAMADDLARASEKVHRLSGLPMPDIRIDVWRDIASEAVYRAAIRAAEYARLSATTPDEGRTDV